MTVLMAVLAFSLDVGCLLVARTELQRAADAAAMAAAWELYEHDENGGSNNTTLTTSARQTAIEFASLNTVLQDAPALAEQDVTVGHMADPSAPDSVISTAGLNRPNAVWVRVRRTNQQNGRIPLYFARILGFDDAAAEADATAALIAGFRGFQAPSDGSNLGILPFALDLDTWNNMVAGGGPDNWRWNEDLEQVQPGSDGIREMNLYPQGTGSPGNRGTVDIGSNSNSTADIARQILQGVSESDLEYHGGKLELDSNGELFLNGDTGISAGIKDELLSIKGQPRVIPVFAEVSGPGNNAEYTIVKFVGIRILEVKLTGSQSSKRVMIQPATMMIRGGIPDTTGESFTEHLYSPVCLVR
jgi:hypothetical protein